ncbi:MAG: outer membrane protein assembly factor BamA [Bacteroidia bacterium]|nr:outer membrane protein assembly factor BamA [Bacteroidia bacterium]
MRNKLTYLLLLTTLLFVGNIYAQKDSASIYPLEFSAQKEIIINNIIVEGNVFVETPLIVVYSNLSIGQKIKIPGTKVSEIISNLWKQDLFSDVKVYIQELRTDTANIIIWVKERPRLSKFTFPGLKRSEARNLKDEVSLEGNMIINENLINSTTAQIKKYYYEKGYFNTKVRIESIPDKDKSNANIFKIYIDKGKKVKLYDFEFTGNVVLTDRELRKSFKDSKRKKNKINIFKSAKFIEDNYELDKLNLVGLYYSKGFRDMHIVSDSVVLISEDRVVVKIKIQEGVQYYFRNITFSGNTVFPDEILHKVLGIEKGDIYNQSKFDEKLFASPDGYDITGLYMDDGYLFFQAIPLELNVEGDSIDVEIKIIEGEQATLRNMIVRGNYKTSDHVIIRELRTRPGQKFSRSDIQRTVRELASLGLFDPQQINVVPKPNPADGSVDIEYTVVEKASDQIELSGGVGPGYGGQSAQFVGTLGLVLNNFSSRKMLNPKLWNPIPVGDGQKLSLRGQSSGFFQAYNLSFTEPWLGGRKPNSFTTSLFHSIYNFNGRPKSDPNRQSMLTTGASVSLAKRLRWPDDNFSIMYSATFQRYKIQNGKSFFELIDNGKSRTLEFQTALSRNALEGGFIFPTGGSSISLSLAFTPPFSMFSNKDWKTVPNDEKYKWVEYHKWKFDAEWYLKPFNKTKFVFMARTRFGVMGGYNKDIGVSPFERFIVGGSGLSGFTFYGTEIVSQRGYDEGEISTSVSGYPNIGGTIFTKHTLELRFPITDNPSATIYVLSFLEAGNTWTKFNNFNPFDLRRAGGVGVRFFLPMFGLIGVDYGYGFDWQKVNPSGKPGHFHFYLGQQF